MRRGKCGAIAAAALLLTGVVSMAPTAGSAPAPAGAKVSSRLTVNREYGGPPVRVGPDVRTVRIRFHGRRGDVVDLVSDQHCRGQRIRLRRHGQWVPRSTHALFRLPDTDRYSFAWRACPSPSPIKPRLQLTRWHIRKLQADGPARHIAARTRGVIYAGRVTVPRTGALRVSGETLAVAVMPSGALGFPQGEAYLQGGFPFTSSDYTGDDLLAPLRAGERVLLKHDDGYDSGPFEATSVQVTHATVDGRATSVIAGRGDGRDHIIEFKGVAGQPVFATRVPDADWRDRDAILLGPDGYVFQRPDWWEFPATGTYRYVARAMPGTDRLASARIRFRTMRLSGATVPTDGTPITLTAASPGEWIMVPFQRSSPDELTLSASAASTTPGNWSASATVRSEYCYPLASPLDCGQGAFTSVDAATPTATIPYYPFNTTGPWLLLMRFAPGQTGSVAIAVRQ